VHLTNDVIEGLKAVGGFFLAIAVPLAAVGKVIAKRKATAFAKKWLESQGEAVTDDDAPKTPLLSESELARQLRAQLDEQERLHSAEARTLRLRVRELELELREERGKNASLTYATSKLREEYRRSMGLDSDAPPANPKSSGAVTVPPARK
jgi:hypothetical protein